MKRKTILMIIPMFTTICALPSCKMEKSNEPELTSIKVAPATTTYTVGYQFTSSDIGSFQAYYSDDSTVAIKSDYTSDPVLPYTFVSGDVANGKDFTFTYQDKSDSFHVNVKEIVHQKYTLSLGADPVAAGTVTGGGEYEAGSSVTLTATLNDGYTFLGWYDGDTKKSDALSFAYTTENSSKTLTAKYAQDKCQITTNITNGTYTGDSEIQKTIGSASITLMADSNYRLPDSIEVTGASYTYDKSTGVVSLSNCSSNIVINCTCILNEKTATIDATPMATILDNFVMSITSITSSISESNSTINIVLNGYPAYSNNHTVTIWVKDHDSCTCSCFFEKFSGTGTRTASMTFTDWASISSGCTLEIKCTVKTS